MLEPNWGKSTAMLAVELECGKLTAISQLSSLEADSWIEPAVGFRHYSNNDRVNQKVINGVRNASSRSQHRRNSVEFVVRKKLSATRRRGRATGFENEFPPHILEQTSNDVQAPSLRTMPGHRRRYFHDGSWMQKQARQSGFFAVRVTPRLQPGRAADFGQQLLQLPRT